MPPETCRTQHRRSVQAMDALGRIALMKKGRAGRRGTSKWFERTMGKRQKMGFLIWSNKGDGLAWAGMGWLSEGLGLLVWNSGSTTCSSRLEPAWSIDEEQVPQSFSCQIYPDSVLRCYPSKARHARYAASRSPAKTSPPQAQPVGSQVSSIRRSLLELL